MRVRPLFLAMAFLWLVGCGAPPFPAPPSPTASPTVRPTVASPLPPSPTPSPTVEPMGDGEALVIGYSVEGRPLIVVRFGTGPRHRMIVAGIHGGYEWNTVELAGRMIEALHADEIVVPPDVSLFVLPEMNPDGMLRGKGIQGRANANGVDLNRNFPWNWAPDWNRAGCWNHAPITAGSAPFSEPETRALRDFLARPDVHVEALVSYHSAALGIFPAGWPQAPEPRSVALAQALARATGYRYPPNDGGCELTGQMVDWLAWELGIPAVDIELSTHMDIDWERNLRALSVFLSREW